MIQFLLDLLWYHITCVNCYYLESQGVFAASAGNDFHEACSIANKSSHTGSQQLGSNSNENQAVCSSGHESCSGSEEMQEVDLNDEGNKTSILHSNN